MGSAAIKASERRTEHILNDLLVSQGWDLQPPPRGNVLYQHEYVRYPELKDPLRSSSKSAKGAGIPEAIVVDPSSVEPLAIIEAKRLASDVNKALGEAQNYASAFVDFGFHPLSIGLAGTTDDEFDLRVSKWDGKKWVLVTYEGNPISWIPTEPDLARIATPSGPSEIRPTIPPAEVLAARANEINGLLRDAKIRDEYRPAIVASTMLALWKSKGEIRRDPRYILRDINASCRDAFVGAGKADLAKSLNVPEANKKLREKARRIARILERLNVTVLTAEHDYLGQLYETFFRYTGGNTIGQFFTPRHVARMMADLCEVTKDDVVLDPACGSGGFLVSCMDRLVTEHHLSREQMVKTIQKKLIGFESEPVTAALCVANMIIRGDGTTGIHAADCLSADNYPTGKADVVLMNPPFPHKNTDTPAEDFVDRALEGLKRGGKLAVILPTSLLAKSSKGAWREKTLKRHSLIAVCQLPDEVFQPFAAVTTTFAVFEKGVPHDPRRKTVFVRLHHDGLTLKKGVRVPRPGVANQIPDALEAINNKKVLPGFSGVESVSGRKEWSVGAYIPSAPPEIEETRELVDVLLRRLSAFYARYAREIIAQREAVKAEDIDVHHYRDILSDLRIANAGKLPSDAGSLGGFFDIYYGLKELHSRDGIALGKTLVISPTEEYNGCYGWLEFPMAIKPPFVTVAQTGSIGEAFVQLEPCAVNDDCLVLLPKEGRSVTLAQMFLAAATLHAEKWRFTYGRKLTPSRVAEFKLPIGLDKWVSERIDIMQSVVESVIKPYGIDYEDESDRELAMTRVQGVKDNPSKLLRGKDLQARMKLWES